MEQPGTFASFAYAFGRRLAKTVNGASTQFLYDGLDLAQQLTTGFFRGTSRGVRIGWVGFAITAAGALAAVAGTLTDRSWLHWAALVVACVGILVGFVGIRYHTVEFFARMRSK